VLVRVALPGVVPDDVEIRTDGARLSVVGAASAGDRSRRPSTASKFRTGLFERTIELRRAGTTLGGAKFADGCPLDRASQTA
jgi:HSP20 family molecular chaperone IbpA